MENFRCTEFLTESPSTSSAPARFGGITATTAPTVSAPSTVRSISSTSTSAPSSRQQQQQSHRRRAAKSDIGVRQSSPNDVMKLLLGQVCKFTHVTATKFC